MTGKYSTISVNRLPFYRKSGSTVCFSTFPKYFKLQSIVFFTENTEYRQLVTFKIFIHVKYLHQILLLQCLSGAFPHKVDLYRPRQVLIYEKLEMTVKRQFAETIVTWVSMGIGILPAWVFNSVLTWANSFTHILLKN